MYRLEIWVPRWHPNSQMNRYKPIPFQAIVLTPEMEVWGLLDGMVFTVGLSGTPLGRGIEWLAVAD